MLMIQECFSIIKVYYKDLEKKCKLNGSSFKDINLTNGFNMDSYISLENTNKKLTSEIEKLKDLIKRRDEELRILLNVVDKCKANHSDQGSENKINDLSSQKLLTRLEDEDNKINIIRNNFLGSEINFSEKNKENISLSNNSFSQKSKIITNTNNIPESYDIQVPFKLLQEINSANTYVTEEPVLTKEILSERLRAYEIFKKYYIKTSHKEENLKIIKEKYSEGEKLVAELAKLKEYSLNLKNEIESVRKEKLIKNIDDIKDPLNQYKIKEDNFMNEYLRNKSFEKQKNDILKSLYSEIKTIQTIVDTNIAKMAKDFEYWYDIMIKKYEWEAKNGKINKLKNSQIINNNYINNVNNSINMNNNSSNISNSSSGMKEIQERIMNRKNMLNNNELK